MRSLRQNGFVLMALAIPALLILPGAVFGAPVPDGCTAANTWTPENAKGLGGNLEVTETICLDRGKSGTYNYKFVNIYSKDGKTEGKLIFKDANVDFWAKSILVENGGSLIIGSPENPVSSTITIHLYGNENDTDGGITCKSDPITCGVPSAPENNVWEQGKDRQTPLGNGVSDYFYKYVRLPADEDLDPKAYFGRKVLALSYGGTIRMFGKKGAAHDSGKGTSWTRLAQSVNPGEMTVTVDRPVDWEKDDWIVMTATDYLPGHSEKLKVDGLDATKTLITIDKVVNGKNVDIEFPHNGKKFSLADVPQRLRDKGFSLKEAETRAAVALLTRNIRVVSEDCGSYDGVKCRGMAETAGNYFGGHTIIRQGFRQFQVQGVEFRQLGQGGRMAHAPVNFHLIREAPAGTFIKDSSINESMTHWIELRGARKVLLQNNVGYNSIGHGFYLADGTETNNTLKGNIGIHARAAVNSSQNPRRVPGVLSMTAKDPHVTQSDSLLHPAYAAEFQAYRSDAGHPAVFHIMNAYNNFEDNMAVGAGTCGACYWIVPSMISGLSLKANMNWTGYASIQSGTPGTAPIKSFKGNFCSTAQHSLMTIGGTGVCPGLSDDPTSKIGLAPVQNPFTGTYVDLDLFPRTSNSTALQSAVCPDESKDCSGSICVKGQTGNCAVNVIDSFTSSFHWAQTNFAAIWLRTNWFLLTNSVLSDTLHGGLTMVSGGSYDQVINGYWALTRNSAFIGNTQPWDTTKSPPVGNPYTTPAGPFHRYPGGLSCESDQDPQVNKGNPCKDGIPASACVSKEQGINIPMDNFAVYQRLYSIYDGPVFQENNAYFQIKKVSVEKCGFPDGGCNSNYMYGQCGRGLGLPFAQEDAPGIKRLKTCILPNAAIGWKQPNGFYYPPAFHSQNLFFKDVDIRHYIIVPLFTPGTSTVNADWLRRDYCYYPGGTNHEDNTSLFAKDFTDVDRQTELNDDDGSLSGLTGTDPPNPRFTGTISVNKDKFFLTPALTMECGSEQTCFQSPYDHVTAVVYPDQPAQEPDEFKRNRVPVCNTCDPRIPDDKQPAACRGKGKWDNNWCPDCQQRNCFGVPLYRQYYTEQEKAVNEIKTDGQGIRMMGAGIWQRSTLIANGGKYYIDTGVSKTGQIDQSPIWPNPGAIDPITHNLNVFEAGKKYNFFLLYAKPSTNVTFQLYVGKGLEPGAFTADKVRMVRAGKQVQDGAEKVVLLMTLPLTFTPVMEQGNTKPFWPEGLWKRTYDPASGILAVTMNMAFADQDMIDAFGNKARKEACKPSSYCEWNDTKKLCCAKGTDCDDSVCGWSGKAIECPSGGCLGFQVEFPADFKADDVKGGKYRPDTEPYPDGWKVKWGLADPSFSEDPKSCTYKDQPPPIPDNLWK